MREVASWADEVCVDQEGRPASREEDITVERTVLGSGKGRDAMRRPHNVATYKL